MALLNLEAEEIEVAVKRLNGSGVSGRIVSPATDRVKLFFGDSICIGMIRKGGNLS